MNIDLSADWQTLLQEELSQPYFEELGNFVSHEYASQTVYPPKAQVFAAFNHCAPQDIKVVILGQDPYHGAGQANGLCFSVNDGIAHPPSLRNIFVELQKDMELELPESGNLERWADQGVFLLNATLTVREGDAGSHQKKGWETFTDRVIRIISETQQNVVFMLWGGYAKKKARLIDKDKHLVLESGHPSPLSANRGYWFGNGHFSKANAYLESIQKTPIQW